MKTTLDIDDELLEKAKRTAAASGMTLKSFVEEALRAKLLPPARARKHFRLKLPTVRGEAPPAVEVMDRRGLHDAMDGLR